MSDDRTAVDVRNRLHQFWRHLLAKLTTNDLHYGHTIPHLMTLAAGAGRGGLSFRYVARKHDWWVAFNISKDKLEENKRIFDCLEKKKTQIEQDFRGPLDWLRHDDGKGSQIISRLATGGYHTHEQDWPTIHKAMIDAMRRLIPALRKHFGQCG